MHEIASRGPLCSCVLIELRDIDSKERLKKEKKKNKDHIIVFHILYDIYCMTFVTPRNSKLN